MKLIELAGCVKACPACQHRDLTKAQSETEKYQWLAHKLADWADKIHPVEGGCETERVFYRHKMTLLCQYFTGLESAEDNPDNLSGWQFGMVHRQRLIPIEQCPAHSKNIIEVIKLLLENIPSVENNFPLKWLNISGGQLTLICKQKAMVNLDWLDASLQQQLSDLGIEGCWLHLNPCTGKKIYAKNHWHLLFGEPRSKDAGGLLHGPAAFQQLIPSLYQQSLQQAADFLKPTEQDRVVDLYCGSGNSMRYWLQAGAQVMGVELGGEALACAKENFAKAYQSGQLQLLRGCCDTRIGQYAPWLAEVEPVRQKVYLNPPRTGLEAAVCEWLVDSQVSQVAYLSCSAGTLLRDLQQLKKGGFTVVSITPYDFFPQTHHIETLALLER